MEFLASFGLWLKERRKQLDLTQADLANRVGCSVMTIRKIEADERRPSRQIAELLAGCLEIAPEDRPTFVKVARAELRVERLPQSVKTLNVGMLLVLTFSVVNFQSGGRGRNEQIVEPVWVINKAIKLVSG